ncbi:hypothetical protein [Orenia marismortui]|uniref:Uncharacterized protein n=1 Tax=Orenia marismortui TaxID=46469 RepID=A0A4R8HQK7_9FIRM|nr:hypothetical protein [Orenia marismortui]TDX59281.1 hypothetical protein C7959_101168 [Orenia marismortui]
MKKIIVLFSVLILTSLLLLGCSKNSYDSFGPAWDVAYKVPLAKDESKTLEELLDETSIGEEIQLAPEGLLDPRVKFVKSKEVDTVNIGEELTTVDLPQINKNINLPLITIGDTTDNSNNVIQEINQSTNATLFSATGLSIPGFALNFDEFSSIVFSNNSVNKMNIEVANNTAATIDSLNLSFVDNNGKKVSTTLAIPANASKQGSWNLSGVNLPQNITINLTADVSGSGSGNLDFTFSIPEGEISKVTGYDLSSATAEISTTISAAESGIESLTFDSGSLALNILPPTSSNLNFAITELNAGGLKDSSLDNGLVVPLADQGVSFNNDQLELSAKIEVSGSNITYDTSESILIDGGFNSSQIAQVRVDLSRVDIAKAEYNLTSTELINELPEDLNKLSLSDDAIAELIIDYGSLTGLEIDFSGVDLVAKYSDGSQVRKGLAEITQNNISQIDSQNSSLNLLHTGSDLVDWLKDLESSNLESIDVQGLIKVDSNSIVTIDPQTSITAKVDVDIPFDFRVEEDYIEEVNPASIDNVEQDVVDDFQENAKEVRLIIEELNNQTPVAIDLEIYVGSVPAWTSYSTDQELSDYLDSLTEEERDNQLQRLYQSDNLLKSLSIDSHEQKKREIVLDVSKADLFIPEDLYVGVKYTIPAGDIVLNSSDMVSIKEAYVKLVTKVNQSND